MRSGTGKRYCIIGAGVIRVKNGKMHGEWVPGSVHHWQARRTDLSTNYHGNFDSYLFEKWIEKLLAFAQRYGHKVLYTPPYHPELQPINLMWGAIKNRIAQDPALTMEELDDDIGAGIKAISLRTRLHCYRKVEQVEDEYFNPEVTEST
ncbi:hypothetical protein PINS_up006190 [Pythium insidiosum]|nr:hypothetical protein PINS_up006190 [Pythium insidiosum]